MLVYHIYYVCYFLQKTDEASRWLLKLKILCDYTHVMNTRIERTSHLIQTKILKKKNNNNSKC